MTLVFFLFTVYPEDKNGIITYKTINMDANTTKEIGLKNDGLDKGLVSINTQDSHYKLIDFFQRNKFQKVLEIFNYRN